jgi:hypothetical protein
MPSLQGNVATISTNLGTLIGTVTSVNNTVATIQTKLGTLTTSVGNEANCGLAALGLSAVDLMFRIVLLALVVRKKT